MREKTTDFVKTRPDRVRKQYKKQEEFTLYGWNACMSAFKKRPESLLRIFFSRARTSQLKEVKAFCGENKIPYRQLDQESLNKVASGVHHEGVVMVVRPLLPQSAHRLIRGKMPEKGLVVALDGIDNPHNQGAILRTCAFFGIEGLMVPGNGKATAIPSSAARMAEGGLEEVPVFTSSDLSSALRDCREQGWFVVGADADSKETLFSAKIKFPAVVVMGNEQEGLSSRVKQRCDTRVRIPGKGQSLNVSVAAGIILAELDRRRKNSK
ncbi:MAG: 23S rRNA (guanosine(2251)-2'-O)-methyltransferase RlmB [Nitrospina sp.]|jgi:RNA methyltransferase, TrmH family|nr:23S rRNA (guanosine(2251)-2'-O)-methyltransferase RlmB [Nitrospina sp.]MBT5549210.1 23S rRNA (guanosine(2251)-2'-O)-methyltransferase RlmB [Nitrospina sp.]